MNESEKNRILKSDPEFFMRKKAVKEKIEQVLAVIIADRVFGEHGGREELNLNTVIGQIICKSDFVNRHWMAMHLEVEEATRTLDTEFIKAAVQDPQGMVEKYFQNYEKLATMAENYLPDL